MLRDIVVIADLGTSYGRGVLRGVSDYARAEKQWGIEHILAKGINWDQPLEKQLAGARGAIVQSPVGRGGLGRLAALKLPAVFVSDHAESYGMPTVRPDHRAVGVMAAEFYLGKGLRHLGYVGHSDEPYSCLRLEGFAARAGQAGIEPATFGVAATDTKVDWGRQVAGWAQALPKPVGLLACDDSCARWTAHFCRRKRIAIPEQVAILGVDDDAEACEMDEPHLSSVITDSQRIGFEAMRVLATILTSGQRPEQPILVPPIAVRERQSTDTVSTSDSLVRDAVRLIRERYSSLESAAAVAAALGVSAGELEKRLIAVLGRGVAGELRRARVMRAKHLLRVTDLSLGKLARECGFSSAASFARDFRQETGVAPSGYRVKAREQMPA